MKRDDLYLECETKNLGELQVEFIERLESNFKNQDDKNIMEYKGLIFNAGDLVVIGARPGMGKTSLALTLALKHTKNCGLPSLFFSPDSTLESINLKLLSAATGIHCSDIFHHRLNENKIKLIAESTKKLASYPVFFNETSWLTLEVIEKEALRIKAEYGLAIIVIDSYHGIRSLEGESPRELARGLKKLAKDFGCIVIVTSPVDRSPERRLDHRPLIGDLDDGGYLEQSADIVMMLYREEYYFPETTKRPLEAEIIIAKNTRGNERTITAMFKKECCRFSNFSEEI